MQESAPVHQALAHWSEVIPSKIALFPKRRLRASRCIFGRQSHLSGASRNYSGALRPYTHLVERLIT